VGTVEATEGRQEMTKAGKRSATMRRITLMLLCGVRRN